jgi:hypothetical protein
MMFASYCKADRSLKSVAGLRNPAWDSCFAPWQPSSAAHMSTAHMREMSALTRIARDLSHPRRQRRAAVKPVEAGESSFADGSALWLIRSRDELTASHGWQPTACGAILTPACSSATDQNPPYLVIARSRR